MRNAVGKQTVACEIKLPFQKRTAPDVVPTSVYFIVAAAKSRVEVQNHGQQQVCSAVIVDKHINSRPTP